MDLSSRTCRSDSRHGKDHTATTRTRDLATRSLQACGGPATSSEGAPNGASDMTASHLPSWYDSQRWWPSNPSPAADCGRADHPPVPSARMRRRGIELAGRGSRAAVSAQAFVTVGKACSGQPTLPSTSTTAAFDPLDDGVRDPLVDWWTTSGRESVQLRQLLRKPGTLSGAAERATLLRWLDSDHT